jgi:predicted RNA-binding Zn-ribbon protein involved in translation (DUF1610 family)
MVEPCVVCGKPHDEFTPSGKKLTVKFECIQCGAEITDENERMGPYGMRYFCKCGLQYTEEVVRYGKHKLNTIDDRRPSIFEVQVDIMRHLLYDTEVGRHV